MIRQPEHSMADTRRRKGATKEQQTHSRSEVEATFKERNLETTVTGKVRPLWRRGDGSQCHVGQSQVDAFTWRATWQVLVRVKPTRKPTTAPATPTAFFFPEENPKH